LHVLVEKFSVFGVEVQYWMLVAVVIVVVSIIVMCGQGKAQAALLTWAFFFL
jgi:hypothetical protein